jgi:hypothetical protein
MRRLLVSAVQNLSVLTVISVGLLTSLPASAGIYSFKVIQTYGWDGNGNYKIMVQSPRNGRCFFVWYPYKLSLQNGQKVFVEFDYSDTHWEKINNPNNGSWSSIYSAKRVQSC